MKKIVLIFGFMLLLSVASFFSCENCGGISGIGYRYFDITGMECSNYEITPSTSSGGYNYKLLKEGDSVGFANHSLRATFQVSYYSYQHEQTKLFATAAVFAFDCAPVPLVNKEGLDTLYVITANALSNLHPAGDTINDIIAIGEGIYRHEDSNKFYSLTDFIRDNRDQMQAFSHLAAPYVAFHLTEEPEFKQAIHAFKLIYQLKNGEVYTAQTPTIHFK